MERAEPGGACGSSQRNLICEDEALTALRLRLALHSIGHQVVADASDGEQAVVLARLLQPDVIQMDVSLPGIDGIQALRQVMRERPAAVVMRTAHGDPETIQQALDGGASGYLLKPFRDEQLGPSFAVSLLRFRELQRERSATAVAALEVEEALRRVRELGEALRSERALARALAESFHGSTPTNIPAVRIETAYEPAAAAQLIGGYFFDFIPLDERRWGIVIADAHPHGRGDAEAERDPGDSRNHGRQPHRDPQSGIGRVETVRLPHPGRDPKPADGEASTAA